MEEKDRRLRHLELKDKTILKVEEKDRRLRHLELKDKTILKVEEKDRRLRHLELKDKTASPSKTNNNLKNAAIQVKTC